MPPRQAVRTEDVEKGRVLFTSIGCAVCHPEQLGAIQGIYSDLLLHDMGESLADPAPAEPTLTFVRHIPREEVTFRPQPQRLPSSRGYFGGSQSLLTSLRAPQPDTVQIKDPDTGGEKLFRVERSNLEAEWRTPPLWGVADSAPYLHDGRAETLADAIVLHGGEAQFSVQQYVNLELAERMQLMAFLQTLRAP
jgi:CxxC motif-containing protein (DUF1111 family)